MGTNILHIDVGNSVTGGQVVGLGEGRMVREAFSRCPALFTRPEEDKTQGIDLVLKDLEEQMSGTDSGFDPPRTLVTVSAGGEPRVACVGVVKGISGESGKRAALLAGATVTDLFCVDDGRRDFQKVSDLRRQDVSLVLMAGGVDEGILEAGNHQLLNIAKILAQGLPKKRESGEKVPLVYAASLEGRQEVAQILGAETEIIWADNVRARLEEEHLESATDAVVADFAENIFKDSRFSGLGRLGSPRVLPSGYVEAVTLGRLHKETDENFLGLSLDGDSVQVISGIKGVFTRTVTPISAVDFEKVARWLPCSKHAGNLGEMLGNLVLHPRLLPLGWDELAVFLAFWKEVIKEGIAQHKASAIELRGIRRQRTISETFKVGIAGGDTILKEQGIRHIVVTGVLSGVLSHSALVSLVLDGVLPSGVTAMYKDPLNALQIGGFLDAGQVNVLESLEPVGVLVGPGQDRERVDARWALCGTEPDLEPLAVKPDEIALTVWENTRDAHVLLEPSRNEDLGDGEGRRIRVPLAPGFSRIYVDGRARPFIRSGNTALYHVTKWYDNLGVFPPEVLSVWSGGSS